MIPSPGALLQQELASLNVTRLLPSIHERKYGTASDGARVVWLSAGLTRLARLDEKMQWHIDSAVGLWSVSDLR